MTRWTGGTIGGLTGQGPNAVGSRVPPHNLQAEESVLGALLLSRDAIGAVSEAGLRPDEFYKPGHQHIFDAIRALYSSGAPVDTITVADELRRAGLLDQVGGTEALHTLQNATPAISNAAHYARIVQDTAILRRLIHVAGDIAELAYGEPDDVTKAVDEAESRVFKVAEERVADSTQLLSESIKGVMDRLEETFARGDIITGTATGYHDVDELLSGLQPSTLNIVGSRPAMGKCVAWDTPMVDSATGEVVTALELVDRTAARGVLTVRALGLDGRQREARVATCVDDGVKPVFTVHTWSGRRVTITASHPLLTAKGWRRLGEIAIGELIAVPTNLPVFGNAELSDPELERLAHHTAGAGAIGQGLPPLVFMLRRPQLARFLNRLFGLGARACVSHCGVARIEYTAASEQLGRDVFHLLVRFGIRAKLRERETGYNRGRRRLFEITVLDPRSLVRFCDEVGIAGQEHAVAHVRTVAAAAIPGSVTDCVPAEAWSDVVKALEVAGGLSWEEVNRRCGRPATHSWHVGRGRLSRKELAELAEALDDDQLRWWASPDVEWDRVVDIVSAGTDPGRRLRGSPPPQLRRRRHLPPQHRVRPGHGDARRADHRAAGAGVLAGDGPQRADPADPGQRSPGRLDEDAQRTAERVRLGQDRPGHRPARGAAVPRRQPAGHGDGDPGQGPPPQGPPRRARPHRRRLPAADERRRHGREPPARGE